MPDQVPGQSPGAYYGELEEAPPSPVERVQAALGPVGGAIRKFGVGKLVFLLALLLAAYVYFFVLPKPSSLTVTVVELDNEAVFIGGAEVVVTADGEPVGSTTSEEGGLARLANLPSGRTLNVRVDAAGRYAPASVPPVTLASGGSQTVRAAVPRRRPLEITGTLPTTVLAPKCTKVFTLQVKNTGAQAEEVNFVADGLAAPVMLTSEKKSVPAGGTEPVSFTISTNEAEEKKTISARVRIRYTNLGVALNLPIEEPPRLDISPSDYTCRQASCTQVIVIKNNGKSTVSDLSIGTRGAEDLVAAISFEGISPPLIAKELPPGGEAKFGMNIASPPKGKTAFLDITATCFSKSISVKSE